MEVRDNNLIVQTLLHTLDATVSRAVNEDREFVDNFVKKLYDSFPDHDENGDDDGDGPEYVFSFLHGGSAFEGLAVSDSADYDVTVVLGEPFVADNFHVERDEHSKFFTLRWKSHVVQKSFCDSRWYVDAAKLRSTLFEDFGSAIEQLDIPGVETTSKSGLAAFTVDIERDSDRNISIDFVPQIPFRSWDQCPDLLPLGDMPRALRRYIDTLNKNKSPVMCLALAVKKKERYYNGDQLFSVSFSMLEKEYFRKNTNVRDMVRLVKFVADRRGWKERPFKFKSYFAKRLAIKNDEQLKTKSLWEGFHFLLECIRDELDEKETFDGYFVDEQVTYKKERCVIDDFIREINAVIKMSGDEINRLL